MATLKEVQLRIEGVKNTQKITKAMKIVSATKLKKWERERQEAELYSKKVQSVLNKVLKESFHPKHPLMHRKSKLGVEGFIIIASDRGLCGSFNSGLFREVILHIEKVKQNNKVVIATIGKRAYDFFKKTSLEIIFSEVDLDKKDRHHVVNSLTEQIVSSYLEEKVDSWTILSNRFSSKTVFGYQEDKIIPVDIDENEEVRNDSLYLFEDDLDDVLEYLIQLYIQDHIYSVILESQNAEEFARMMAMDQATENADDLIEELTLFYNRTRQMVITKEISEIVGGAEALK